jgi:dethiobiotin synthetase
MPTRRQTRFVVITGSDTGVGKTVLTAWLTRQLRAAGVNAVALKPLCSGGRSDARALHSANGKTLSLDEVNPWHYPAALAPVLAARRVGQRVDLSEVLTLARAVAGRFDLVLLEGAGGLLSPLGEDFDNRDLIRELRATPVVVVPNRLGAVNQVRLVIEALPRRTQAEAQVVLSEVPGAGAAGRTNPKLLREWLPKLSITLLPWVAGGAMAEAEGDRRRVAAALKSLAGAL